MNKIQKQLNSVGRPLSVSVSTRELITIKLLQFSDLLLVSVSRSCESSLPKIHSEMRVTRLMQLRGILYLQLKNSIVRNDERNTKSKICRCEELFLDLVQIIWQCGLFD